MRSPLQFRPVAACAVFMLTVLWTALSWSATRELEAGADLPRAAQEARDGDVLRLKAGRYTGPVVVDGKRLIIEGPAGGEAVIAPGPSNVVLAAVNGGSLELSAISVETSAASPLGLFAQRGSISCNACKITGEAGSAVYVEAGTLTLEGSSVSVPAGEAVLALSGSTVHLSNVGLRSDAGRPLVAQEAVSVTIVGSTFSGTGGTVLTGPAARIEVSRSEFSSSGDDQNALHVETGGECIIADTVSRGGRFGFAAALLPGATCSLDSGSARGVSGGIYLEQKDQGTAARVTLAHYSVIATGTGEQPVALRATGPLVVEAYHASFLSGGVAAVAAAGGAQLRVDRGILSAATLAAAVYGDVPGAIDLARTIAVPPASISSEGVHRDAPTEKYSQVLSSDAVLAGEFADLAAAAPGLPPPDQICLGSCPDGWPPEFAALAERTETAAAKLGTVELEVVDGAGRAMAVPFLVLTFEGEMIAESADGKPAAVAEGAYLVERMGDASLAIDLDVAAGAAEKARIELPERLWLDINFQPDQAARIILFEPVEAEAALAIMRADDGGYAFQSRLARRGGATDEDVAAALAAARHLVSLRLTWTNDADSLAVLASVGVEDDAQLLADFFHAEDVGSFARPLLRHLAYLEHRLGRLGSGMLAKLATDAESPMSARAQPLLLLDYYGAADVREELIALFQDPQRFFALHRADRAALAARLSGSDWPDFPAAAGRLLSNAVERISAGTGGDRGLVDDITVPLAGYLAMFGTAEEKRIIADQIMARAGHSRWTLTPWLARFAVDPAVIAEELVEDRESALYHISAICPYHRLRGEGAFHAIMENMIAAYANHSVAIKDYVTPAQQAYHSGDLTARAYLGACRPDPVVAQAAYAGMIDPLGRDVPGTWFPGFQSIEPLLEYMTRVGFMTDNIRATAPDLVLRAWDTFTTPPWSDFKAERMAIFRAFTKQGDVDSRANDQIERRLYVVRHIVPDGYSGALAGHLEVRPSAVDGRLVIDVRPNQTPYYNSFGGIADAIATEGGKRSYWAHQPYVEDGGRKLMEKVMLQKGAQDVPLTERPVDASGFFRFETDLPADDLSNLVLKVDLALFDDRRSLEFDLFASGFARQQGIRP